MRANEYQQLAARTINHDLNNQVIEEHAKKELGDLLWFIAEYCTAMGWTLEEVMTQNIEKLKARYPKGFEYEKSLNREEGDV